MADEIRKITVDCYVTLVPRYWAGRVTDAKVGRVTQKRPQVPEGPVVKLQLRVPAIIFEPYIVDTVVEIEEGRVVPIEVEQRYEIQGEPQAAES